MRTNGVSFTAAVCWLSFWLGAVLSGAALLYARFQQVPFIEGLANGLMNVTSPDSTVALLLALGLMLLVIGVIFVPLFYLTVAVQGLIRVLTLKPIRI